MKTSIAEREERDILAGWQIGRVQPFPTRVPERWGLVRLIDVATLESGHTPSRHCPDYWKGDIPWISLHDTDGLDVPEIFDTAQTIGELGLANSSARLLPRGTVVFSRTATVGKATVMGRSMATSQDFANYVCSDRVHNHFLVHLFRFLAPEWKRLKAGSTLNTIYMPVFRDLQVLLPPPPRAASHRISAERCGCAARRAGPAHRQEARPQAGRHAAAPHRPDPPAGLQWEVGDEAPRRHRSIHQGARDQEGRGPVWRIAVCQVRRDLHAPQ
ncbi:hypothetical protein BVG81_003905 [Haliangium sp. UPWRP_2]|nr:hypothetical protein BVG81_003905 [Haliangium sp. UPWRP_2]